jgi:hypothetical protein
VAYTAAAGLGAFFGGQAVEGQVTESHAFAGYPATLSDPQADHTWSNEYFYLDIDGDGANDFKLEVGTSTAGIAGTRPGNLVISPHIGSYYGCLFPWTNGVSINATTTGFAGSRGFLADVNAFYYHNYFGFFNPNPVYGGGPGPYELGFSFTGGDGKTHFGYMNIQVNWTEGSVGYEQDIWDFSVLVNGIYYNKTPNAAIVTGSLPPVIVSATSIQVGAKNAVTINFTSSDNAAASAFTLETSPVLGASASWTTDTKAVISSSGPGVYQAVTTGTGGPSQFFRIKH